MTTDRTVNESATTSWIPLLVPAQDYLELAGLVAARQSVRGAAGQLPAVGATVDLASAATPSSRFEAAAAEELAKLRPWDIRDLGRLASSDVVTAQRWARALDVCCAHVGAFLSTEQVAQESGMTVNEWRDAPRKMTRHVDRHYPNAPQWPLCAVSGRTLGRDDQVYWATNAEQAARWAQVRGARLSGSSPEV